jgi:hypothetical protein
VSFVELVLAACSLVIAGWGLCLLLDINGVAERLGRREAERRQGGYGPGVDDVPFARALRPATTAGARIQGVVLLVFAAIGIVLALTGLSGDVYY